MDKRTFLKTSGTLVTGSMLSRLLPGEEPDGARKNWAGNYTFRARHLYRPKSVAEVQEIVKKAGKVKALGAKHSFNSIADSPDSQISLEHLTGMALDRKARTVTVGGGVKYGQLAPYLDGEGFALHNLASLPHVTVAGACATGTHGSGNHNGNLSSAVSAMEFVTANGDLATLSRKRDGDRFSGAVVHLGALGVATKVTLDVQPAYAMTQAVYENLSFAHLKDHLEEIFASGYSVSLFTDWQGHRAAQVWIKRRIEGNNAPKPEPEFFGAKLATRKLHPVTGHPAEACTDQMGIPGPWYERLPHFKMNFTPSSGDEIQSEYFVPRDRGYEAILAVEKLRDRVTPHLFVTELRTIDADDLWMSPCYRRPAMTIHFTWKPEREAVQKLLPQIESQLAPFDPRPHWAKVFTLPRAQVRSRYARLRDYEALIHEYDPAGKFRNEFLGKHLLGG
jgi:xylitol oxidase